MKDSILIEFVNYFKKDIEDALTHHRRGDNIIADGLLDYFGEYGLRKILEELKKYEEN